MSYQYPRYTDNILINDYTTGLIYQVFRLLLQTYDKYITHPPYYSISVNNKHIGPV